MTLRTISDVAHDYRWYYEVVEDIGDLPAYFPADAYDDREIKFAHNVFRETGTGSAFTGSDHSVIATDLERLSKKAPTLAPHLLTCYKF